MTFWQRLEEPAHVVVCGASRGIGLALTAQLLARADIAEVWAIARHANQAPGLLELQAQYGQRLRCLDVDVCDEQALSAMAMHLRAAMPRLHLLLCTVGVLQDGAAKAEKGLSQISLEGLLATFQRNSFAPILLLKHLLPLLRGQHACTVAALSARVGSIGDNRLGGWYSYRASKAALNQLLRTASIELKRLNPASTVLALHPGTTDTQLSRPFQGNVPPGKLFSPAFAATCILALVSRHGPAQSGTFWAWDGTPIPW